MKNFYYYFIKTCRKRRKLSPGEIQEIAQAHIVWAAKLPDQGHLVSADSLHEKG